MKIEANGGDTEANQPWQFFRRKVQRTRNPPTLQAKAQDVLVVDALLRFPFDPGDTQQVSSSIRSIRSGATSNKDFATSDKSVATRSKKLLVTRASLLVTRALLLGWHRY